MKRLIASLTVGSLLALGLVACGEPEPEYAAVCVDPDTELRLEDDACENGDDDYLAYAVLWYMLASSSHPYPAVGERADSRYFKSTRPKNARIVTGLPKTGGTSLKSWTTTTSKPGGTTTGGTKSGTSSWGRSGGSSGRTSTGRR